MEKIIPLPKSTIADRPTLGAQVYEVLKKHAGKKSDIEAGDLGREMGKKYISELNSLIEANGKQDRPYYILAIKKRSKIAPNIVSLVTVSRWTKPAPEPDCDLWRVQNQELSLEWSLPGEAEMDLIMKTGKDFDPQLIDWILKFRLGNLQ